MQTTENLVLLSRKCCYGDCDH